MRTGIENPRSGTLPELPQEQLRREAENLLDKIRDTVLENPEIKDAIAGAWLSGNSKIVFKGEVDNWVIGSSPSPKSLYLERNEEFAGGGRIVKKFASIEASTSFVGDWLFEVRSHTRNGDLRVYETNTQAAIDIAKSLIDELKAAFVTETPKDTSGK